MKLKVIKEFKDKNNDEFLREINTCFEENDKKRAWFLINGNYCIEDKEEETKKAIEKTKKVEELQGL